MPEEFQEPTSLNADEAADQLFAQSGPSEEGEDQVETDDQEEADALDADAEVTEETPDDETEEAAEEDVSDEADEAELFYEIDGEEVSLAQIQEWREGGLKAKDYTQKTQALSEKVRDVEAERIAVSQEKQAIQTERAQLQEALASVAIGGEIEPNWVELAGTLPPQEYQARRAEWDMKQAQKQQAQQAYQALQAQEQNAITQRETAALLHHKPDWVDPVLRDQALQKMQAVGQTFGFSTGEIAGLMDHRMIRVLDRLAALEGQAVEVEQARETASKRVIKAEPRRSKAAKASKDEASSKALKKRQSKLARSGKIEDATEFLMAQLNS